MKDGTKLKAPLEQQHNTAIIDALAGYDKDRMLAVKGIVKRDKYGVFKSFDSVEHVSQLDPLDVEMRLDELHNLRDGWLNGMGVAIDAVWSKALAKQFEEFFDSELALPHLYPVPEGGILAEWTLGDWSVSLEIQMPSHRAQYQALNLVSNECVEFEIDLRQGATEWARLNDALRALSPSRPA